MKKFTADLIITGEGESLSDAVIVCDDEGLVLDLLTDDKPTMDVQRFNGVLCPGFINAHCHLELSHLKGLIPTGTGLIPFIRGVLSLRDYPQNVIQEAIRSADEEMYRNGIQAVGDISNTSDTATVKHLSPIKYYSFVEVFDFINDDAARDTMERIRPVYDAFSDKGADRRSYVPHAPYSVSASLFEKIGGHTGPGDSISMHNQETPAENEFFITARGDLASFYMGLKIPIPRILPTGTSSLQFAMDHLPDRGRLLLVHNTCSTSDDIAAAHTRKQDVYWVTCPNANLYIENRLPHYQSFVNANATMCIGTDSLTSNWQLCILEEMKTIKRYQSHLDDAVLIRWASLNGAQALGFDDRLGSLKPGKKPGLIWLEGPVQDGRFDVLSVVASRRIL